MLVMTAVVAWFRRIARGHRAQRRGNVFIENGIWIIIVVFAYLLIALLPCPSPAPHLRVGLFLFSGGDVP